MTSSTRLTSRVWWTLDWHGAGEQAKFLPQIDVNTAKARSDRRRDFINGLPSDRKIKTGGEETGVSIKPISVSGTERIVRCAFDYARKNGRKQDEKGRCIHELDGFLAAAFAGDNGARKLGWKLAPRAHDQFERRRLHDPGLLSKGHNAHFRSTGNIGEKLMNF